MVSNHLTLMHLEKILQIYEAVSDFYNVLKAQEPVFLPAPQGRRRPQLDEKEMLTILIAFHSSDYKHFKAFYQSEIGEVHRFWFPDYLSYHRFIELMPRLLFPLFAFLQVLCANTFQSGLYFVDSTALPVCHNRRIASHKTFVGSAERGKTSVDWFYGFKLHLIINHLGQIVAYDFTAGNADDRSVLARMTRGLKGFLVGDKGYLSQQWEAVLGEQGLKLLTKKRKNMKTKSLTEGEKTLLRKRAVIESVIRVLKAETTFCHSRHRSPVNFLVHLFSALCAYQFRTDKPAIFFPTLPETA